MTTDGKRLRVPQGHRHDGRRAWGSNRRK